MHKWRKSTWRWALLAALVGGAFTVPTIPAQAEALQAGCVQSGVSTVTCTYTSGANTFTVPSGVSSVHVEAVGGSGADALAGGIPGAGGHGARVVGDLTVSAVFNPGFILTGKFILGVIIAWFVGGHLGLSIIYCLIRRYDTATIPKIFDVGSNKLFRLISVIPNT